MMSYLGACLLLCVVSLSQCRHPADCHSFNGDASHCTHDHRGHHQYADLDGQLQNALAQEHFMPFLVNITVEIYRFLYPCVKHSQSAAAQLFYHQQGLMNTDDSWWSTHVLDHYNNGHNPLIGKRGSHSDHFRFQTERELLHSNLNDLNHATDGHGGCIMYLLDKYKDAAAKWFQSQYPAFPLPSTTHITTHPTTPKPTPSHVTHQSSAKPVTHKPTTNQVHKTTLRPTIQASATCTHCSGLKCLMNAPLLPCAPGVTFCLTTIEDNKDGRLITRSCANKAKCDSIHNEADCENIENDPLSNSTLCEFCCHGFDCNHAPQLLPDSAHRYIKVP